ncbi:MAG: CinA family protein [Legionellaceae bacterium]|nr:CinA family protein [Legionellaceae bacterium]
MATTLQTLIPWLQQHSLRLVTAESCTGGMLAAMCTDVAGSSAWFERGFVSYSNAAKTDMLAVPPQLIAEQGAVSEAVAEAMARGALANSQAQIAIAITGIAGPGGGSVEKPVGMVCFAVASAEDTLVNTEFFQVKTRAEIRYQSCQFALKLLHRFLRS